ncbi:MAG: GGDEF domain-containing protein [Solirubrobacteraceae bacterium]
MNETAASARYGEMGSLLVVGLDHFEFVNDALGRQAGDSLIARAGQLLEERLRDSDVLARLGGDEFGVLLPKADSTHALRVADSLLGALRCQRIRIGGLTHTVTASIGVASFEYGRQVRGEHVLVNADRAMWDAKDDGCDRAVLYSTTTPVLYSTTTLHH